MTKQASEVFHKSRWSPGIRGQLMTFLCLIGLFMLGLFWFLSTQLLEPIYHRRITHMLETEAEAVVSLIDRARAEGTVISSRDFGVLVVDPQFKNELYEQLGSSIERSNLCVDISDSTVRAVFEIENLYPCLMHNSTLASREEDRGGHNTATVMQLRTACRREGSLYKILDTVGGSSQIVVGRCSADKAYIVLVAASLVHVGEAGDILGLMLPVIAAVVFVLSLAGAWLFSQWFTRPLRELSGAARQVAQGNYNITVESARADELGMVAQDFNHMAREVQRTAQLQRDLLANVSHDLRTPLTLIKGYAETVRDLTGDNKTRRDEQMNIIVDETDRLSALVNSVMELSKVSNGTEKCDPVRFDMTQLCEEVSERYEAVCEQNGWELRLELAEQPLNVWADPAMMERVLHNLLGNAMHHIGPDGVFILRAKPCAEGCRVEIEDHGAGIAADDLPYIFDRYYRSRSDAGKVGTGLGLSITKAIFQQHGFRFGVDSTVGKGTVFWFIMTDKKEA